MPSSISFTWASDCFNRSTCVNQFVGFKPLHFLKYSYALIRQFISLLRKQFHSLLIQIHHSISVDSCEIGTNRDSVSLKTATRQVIGTLLCVGHLWDCDSIGTNGDIDWICNAPLTHTLKFTRSSWLKQRSCNSVCPFMRSQLKIALTYMFGLNIERRLTQIRWILFKYLIWSKYYHGLMLHPVFVKWAVSWIRARRAFSKDFSNIERGIIGSANHLFIGTQYQGYSKNEFTCGGYLLENSCCFSVWRCIVLRGFGVYLFWRNCAAHVSSLAFLYHFCSAPIFR